MKLVRKFLVAELIWGAGILTVIVVVDLASNASSSGAQFVSWFARALTLGAFPAGISVAADIRDAPNPWSPAFQAIGGALVVAILVFVLDGLIVPASGQARSLVELARTMGAAAESWETRNDAAWRLLTTLFAPVQVMLMGAIGAQVGLWAGYALPRSLHRPLFWLAGIGLVVTSMAMFDTTYETIVLHTAADARFAAFYTLLIPASICAGLGLATLALMRGADLTRKPA